MNDRFLSSLEKRGTAMNFNFYFKKKRVRNERWAHFGL